MSEDDEPRYVANLDGFCFSDKDWIQDLANLSKVMNGGQPLHTESQAWAYFVHQNSLVDTESDNWNLFAQFSDDPTFNYARLKQELRTMQGKQYHFSSQHSAPPYYWVLQEVDQQSMAILETWAFVGIEIYKCNTIYDLIQSRFLAVTEHLSSSMNILESTAPLPLLRELKFWQSAPVQVPGQEEDTLMIPAIATDKLASETENGPSSNDIAKAKAKGKQKTKKPPASDMALLLAMQQMQRALPTIVGDGSARTISVKSKEAEEAEKLKNQGVLPNAAVPRIATKRSADETNRDPAKQARFAV